MSVKYTRSVMGFEVAALEQTLFYSLMNDEREIRFGDESIADHCLEWAEPL